MPPLLELENVSREFTVGHRVPWRPPAVLRAVDGVSLQVAVGETFGLVGESGCGKTTLGRMVLRLTSPTSGDIRFGGSSLAALRGTRLRQARQHVQVVFQDPLGSLNPRMRVGEIVGEPLRAFGLADRRTAGGRVAELLAMVGLDPAKASSYPRQLSGGQRQRVGIARALAPGPRLIVADEAVSALDVSVQAQVVNLFADLQESMGLSYLFIGHNLAVVRQLAHRVGVMYLGRLVEVADRAALFGRPAHPYTAALLSAAPADEPGAAPERIMLRGEAPSPVDLPGGCRFRTRCWLARQECADQEPPLTEVRPGQRVACHFPL